jgi:hypothetical protein
VRAIGAAEVQESLASAGIEPTRQALLTYADAVIARARAEMTRLSALTPSGLEAQASAASLQSVPVFAFARAHGVRDAVSTTTEPSVLLEMGRILAEENFSVTYILPAAEQILNAGIQAPTSSTALAVLNGYDHFLDQASTANENYATTVLAIKEEVNTSFSDQGLSAAIFQLHQIRDELDSAAIPSFGAAALRTAITMTDFWMTAALVANAQAYGNEQEAATDVRRAFAAEAQDSEIDNAAGTVASVATRLDSAGIHADLSLWSSGWALALSTAYRGDAVSTEANWLAQSELWYDVIEVMMLNSMAGARTSS